MKKICIFFILFSMVIIIQAKKTVTLEDLMRPDMIGIGNDRVYITEKANVYIYSLQDFRLLKKFGKEGEGPREFQVSPFMPMIALPYDDKIYVSSMAKLSLFSKDGEYIKEFKIMPFTVFTPFNNQYLATGSTSNEKGKTVLSVNLYNESFEKVKELYASDMQVGPAATNIYPVNSFSFLPYKDRIYVVVGKEGFVIDVFDEKGTQLYRIKKEEKPIKVSEEYKAKTLESFKQNPFTRQFYDLIKARSTFRTHYPPIRDMFVEDDYIYLLTFKKKQGNSEIIIMDLKGNEQKRVFLPCPDNHGMNYYPKYDIENKKFYTLVENIDEETWELHIFDIF